MEIMEGTATDPPDTEARVAELETRLAQLEERLRHVETHERTRASAHTEADAEAPADAGSSPGPGAQPPRERPPGSALDSQFWILEELRRQAAASGSGSSSGGTPHGGAIAYAGLLGDESVQWQYQRPADHVLDLDFADSAAQLAAIGSPVRLRILQGVLHGACSVAQLGELPDMGSTGQLYHHLNQLSAAGWLVSRQRGRWEVPGERVIPLLTIVLATQR